MAGLKVALVTASWHADLCDRLRERALAAVAQVQAEVVWDVRVPGALELPVVAQACARSGRVDAVVVLGAVIRGGTPHFDYVCSTVSHGVGQVALGTAVPVANGVLTCDTYEQAHARSGFDGSAEDKGFDATMAALATAVTLRTLG
ncbi:MAG: 6,7-dimethyl-8-ribityllumazine synthase [Actinobacteria bacterium]|nr:6,7-dimethyl-8-ribityllumazine synthase [Actinomycetota bacterium]